MGAIFFGGNFMARGQFFLGKFSSEVIVRGAIVQEAIFLGGNYPRGQLLGEQLSREQSSKGKLSGGQLS